MRYPEWLSIYRDDPAGPSSQDTDGLLTVGPLEYATLVFEGSVDVQERPRRKAGQESGPFTVARDADIFVQDEEGVELARAGDRVLIEWEAGGDPSSARVVGTSMIDGRILVDWLNR